MDKLRRDVSDAFDQEQSALGNLAGTRERLVRNALSARETRSDSRVQMIAGIAAVVIAAIVIVTFAYVRAGTHQIMPIVPSASPRPSTSPTPLGRALNVDASTPVILYHDPGQFDQIDGMTWDGKRSGRVDWAV